VFGMRFLVATYRAHRQAEPQPNPTRAPTPVPEGLPVPVSAVPQAPVIIPPAQTNTANDTSTDLATLHTRFYAALLTVLFFTAYASNWPPFYRDISLIGILFVINSYWVPQIYRNALRGCRKALRWDFVFGTSACRLAVVFYLYLYPHNIFQLETKPKAVAMLCGWLWIQCMALLSQDMFGPRFLVPSHSLPPVYDYHSALPAEDEEAAQQMGTPVDGETRRSFDCVVCMQTVEVPVVSADGESASGGGSGVGLLGRRGYMVTPCKHVFHSQCLEGWMRFRLQCPICRNPLPAV